MAIKHGKKKNFEKPAQNKVKATSSEIIIINDSGDDNGHSDLPAEVMVKKQHSVKANASDWKGAKKKKKKIRNEACSDLHIIESNAESKSVKKLKKIQGKPKKKGDQGLSCEPNCEVHSEGVSEEQQEEQQGSSLLTREAHKRDILSGHGYYNDFTTKKKKKRKHKPDCFSVLQGEENENKFKQRISPVSESVSQEMFSKKKWTSFQNADSDTGKKKKVASCLISTCNRESSNGVSDKSIVPGYQSQESLGFKGKTLDCTQLQKDTAHISKEENKVIKKKKKVKKQKVAFPFALASKQENHSGASSENLKKAKFKKKLIAGVEKSDLILDSKGASKIKKRKKVQAEVVRSQPALSLDGNNVLTNEGESAKKKRKKKMKKSKGAQNSMRKEEDGSKQSVKKRKAGQKGGFQDSSEEPSLKKARIKLEAKEEEEIKVVAFKKGNCDEINIDKLRRQALQEEIDRESGKTQVSKEEDESNFGQWSTAEFESSEQKTKFLRLLGGFKKGSSTTQESVAPKLNMALDKSREQNLQRNLLAAFEKAVDLKHHRGIGLGFQPAPQKHVHIDKYASKSIKFEV